MQRRNLVLAAAALAAGATRAQQHSGARHTLPFAPSSPDPYARLQGGLPHQPRYSARWKVFVAGGGAVLGGSVQSAVHEAFMLG